MLTSRQRRRRLRTLDANYHRDHGKAHAAFNRAVDSALHKHKLSVTRGETTLIDYLKFPTVFHADVEAARSKFLIDINAAKAAYAAGAAALPKLNVRVIGSATATPQ
jgi:hypothetical protein